MNGFSFEDRVIWEIQRNLTPDLLKGQWIGRRGPYAGHCYVATETLYWILRGPASKFRPYVLSHKTWPDGLKPGETHWYLMSNDGKPNGMMNYPDGGSKRSKILRARLKI